MIRLSVNINKVATLRNARGQNTPDLIEVAKDIERFGANGITVHPRPDERHIRYSDVEDLSSVLTTEFNVEGYPNKLFIDLVKKVSEERDEIAFSEIFDFIAPKINAYYIQNNLSIEQAEELTQEVLSTIWLKAELFNPEKSKFITWSFTIARNKKIDFYRKNQKNVVNEEDIRDFLYTANKSDDYEIESTIKDITKDLDENQKKLIKMSFFEQKSHKNIARELEIPLGTVKSRIRASLNKMQKHIQ